MDDSKTDADVLSCYSNTEAQFLKQVKECQHHLNCMEKLFLDLQKVESDKEIRKSLTSLNSKLSKSFPDLQLLMREYETKINLNNNVPKESSETITVKGIESVNVESVDSKDNSAPLTFVIQVPNTLLNSLKQKISSDHFSDILSQNSTKYTLKSEKRRGLSWLVRKLFQKKKHASSTIRDMRISQDISQFFKPQSEDNTFDTFQNSRQSSFNDEEGKGNHTEKSLDSDNFDKIEIDGKSTDSKQSHQNLIFPITYNFDGKSSTPVLPNICIQHEIKPQADPNVFSHSIKIKNELPTDFSSASMDNNTSAKEKEDIVNQKDKSTEILIDSLIKALLKTTEKLDILESIKALAEKLSEDEPIVKTSDQVSIDSKTKKNKRSKIFNHLLPTSDKKSNDNKSSRKTEQKAPKRQLSKLSVCSNSNSVNTSDEDIYKSSMTNSRLQHIQRHNRCQSPSMYNYLVCQSERDINVNSFH